MEAKEVYYDKTKVVKGYCAAEESLEEIGNAHRKDASKHINKMVGPRKGIKWIVKSSSLLSRSKGKPIAKRQKV